MCVLAWVLRRLTSAAVAAWCLLGALAPNAEGAFLYPPVAGPILSATFSADFAALTAHRFVGGFPVNAVRLLGFDGTTADLSPALFGTTDALAGPATLDLGPLGTSIVSTAIPAFFFPALAAGAVGLDATFTDTADGLFAIDFLGLTIVTPGGTIVSTIDGNNGFGIGLPDNSNLPAPLPASIAIGASGTGFDETISSKTIHTMVPEPPMVWPLTVALAFSTVRWWRRRVSRSLSTL